MVFAENLVELRPQTIVVGSDQWFDVVMNFNKEVTGISLCRRAFEEQSVEMDPNTRERKFNQLVEPWLHKEVSFYLAEFGCGKYLPVQPIYKSLLGKENGAIFISPSDLHRFGDLAKRYIEADELVGRGLTKTYEILAESPPGTMAGIMSGTEEYQAFNSTTDVINLMMVVGEETDGTKIVDGQYLVLGKVLTREQRRFVHNLFRLWGTGGVDEVPTTVLLTENQEGEEYQRMLKEPSVFKLAQFHPGFTLFNFAKHLDDLFYRRFGQHLVGGTEMSMYPEIETIVAERLPEVKAALLAQGSRTEYYTLLREMLYQCQKIWAQKQFNDDSKVQLYLNDLARGVIPLGFEFGFSDSSLGIDSFGQPLGFKEMGNKYCEIHKKAYAGHNCPECPERKKLIQSY